LGIGFAPVDGLKGFGACAVYPSRMICAVNPYPNDG